MSIDVSPIANNQSFGALINRLNQITEILRLNCVTADSSANGSVTVGNVQVVGYMAANTLVGSTLRGGNVESVGDMTIASNTYFTYDNIDYLYLVKDAGTGIVTYNLLANNAVITANVVDYHTDSFSVSGANTNINSYLTVNNTLKVRAANTYLENTSVSGNVSVTGNLDLTGNVHITGNTVFTGHIQTNSSIESGDIYVTGNTQISDDLTVSGTIFGTVVSPSDIRYKTNVTPIEQALDIVKKIRGVSFNWNLGDNLDRPAKYGVIAQEVKSAAPIAVTSVVGQDEKEFLHVDYDGLIAILYEAVKTLSARVEALENNGKTA